MIKRHTSIIHKTQQSSAFIIYFFISNTLKIFQFEFYIYIKTHKYVSKLLKTMIHVTPTETPNFSRPLEFMRAPAPPPLHQQSKSSLSGKQLKWDVYHRAPVLVRDVMWVRKYTMQLKSSLQ